MVNKFLALLDKWKKEGGAPGLITLLDGRLVFSQILLPACVLLVYFASFEWIIFPILDIQDGITKIFINRALGYFSIFTLAACLIFIAIWIVNKGGKFEKTGFKWRVSRGDLILILLPLTPVVQYLVNNQDILTPIESLAALIFFALFSSILIIGFPALLGSFGSPRTLISLGVAFAFTITSMAMLSNNFTWHEKGSFKIQLIFFGLTFLVTWLLYGLSNKKILHGVIVIVFLSNTVMQFISQDAKVGENSQTPEENKLLDLAADRKPLTTPSIYLLIYDSYVTNETMLGYGIDNSVQEAFLEELGFNLYQHTYSVADFSVGTMSKVLDVSREVSGDPKSVVAGDGNAFRAMQNLGYETYGLFPNDFYFRKFNPSYDYSIPEPRTTSLDILLRAILGGEFRFDIGFDMLPREEFIQSKHDIFGSITGNPKLVYMHSTYPGHSQNSGACLTDEIDRFRSRLEIANTEMQDDVQRILDNDPEAIIVVAGDHGPYLTKNCASLNEFEEAEITRLDIQDRFGTFLAIRWPDKDFERFDEIVVLQDLFPVIFAYLFNDESFLDAKIDPVTFSPVSKVRDGIITRGINRGEALFVQPESTLDPD